MGQRYADNRQRRRHNQAEFRRGLGKPVRGRDRGQQGRDQRARGDYPLERFRLGGGDFVLFHLPDQHAGAGAVDKPGLGPQLQLHRRHRRGFAQRLERLYVERRYQRLGLPGHRQRYRAQPHQPVPLHRRFLGREKRQGRYRLRQLGLQYRLLRLLDRGRRLVRLSGRGAHCGQLDRPGQRRAAGAGFQDQRHDDDRLVRLQRPQERGLERQRVHAQPDGPYHGIYRQRLYAGHAGPPPARHRAAHRNGQPARGRHLAGFQLRDLQHGRGGYRRLAFARPTDAGLCRRRADRPAAGRLDHAGFHLGRGQLHGQLGAWRRHLGGP